MPRIPASPLYHPSGTDDQIYFIAICCEQSIIIAMLNAISTLRHPNHENTQAGASAGRSFAVRTLDAAPNLNQNKGGKIALPTMEGICFEKVKHIAYLEASGNYTVLHFIDKRQTLVCKTLREVELMLPNGAFARIHRSHTIHLRHIKKYVKGKGGHVLLQNGATLSVSSGQKDLFMDSVKEYYGLP